VFCDATDIIRNVLEEKKGLHKKASGKVSNIQLLAEVYSSTMGLF